VPVCPGAAVAGADGDGAVWDGAWDGFCSGEAAVALWAAAGKLIASAIDNNPVVK
jgi:hypothetical protein